MVDVSSIAPNAMDDSEAKETDHLYRVLGYGNPGVGKTHVAYTFPEPVCIIDTEGKADAIAEKFDTDFYIWKVDHYDEARQALGEALDVLDAYQNEESQIGTLVVDSITEMWDWAQQKYVEQKNPGKSPEEVNFKSALQSEGSGDWKLIKRLHNERFREPMLSSDYHLYWTAKSEEDYAAILSGDMDDPPAKPSGEKNNIYKATELVHFYEGQDGTPHANLKKTALTKWRFGGLEWPTFPKMREIIETVADAEAADEQYTLGEILDMIDYDIDLYDGDPDVVMKGGE